MKRVALWAVAVSGLGLAFFTGSEAAGGGGTGTVKGVLKSPYVRLAEGVAFIERVDGLKFEPPPKNPVMDQKNKIFTPHLLPVLAGTTVDFPNTDDVRHSVFSRPGSKSPFNLGQYDAGVVKQVKFEEVGVTHLGCNIHSEMSGYIVVCQNPYFAVTDRKGEFTIPDVPAGSFKLTFFHEKIQAVALDVTVEAGKETSVEFANLKRK
ncbi:MAG: hypothetical protein HY720_02540 [Planctomycetes bacterium]|nr:hypothetical protein [Planctomycetota bacterium]